MHFDRKFVKAVKTISRITLERKKLCHDRNSVNRLLATKWNFLTFKNFAYVVCSVVHHGFADSPRKLCSDLWYGDKNNPIFDPSL